MASLTISDAARRCGVTRRTLQRAIRAGRLPLTADHQLTLEALQQAGYTPTPASQRHAAATTPQPMSQDLTQGLTQVLSQAIAPLMAQLDALVARLDILCHTLESQRQTASMSQRPAAATSPTPDPLLAQIVRWQQEGMTLRAIAARLNAEGVPTRSGHGRWWQTNISRELARMAKRQAP
jgi:Recombinase